jgi:hypothetical protein
MKQSQKEREMGVVGVCSPKNGIFCLKKSGGMIGNG